MPRPAETEAWKKRAKQLLDHLEQRSRKSPGLYSCKLKKEFLSLSRWLAKRDPSHSKSSLQRIVEALEWIRANPSHTHHARALAHHARRTKSPITAHQTILKALN